MGVSEFDGRLDVEVGLLVGKWWGVPWEGDGSGLGEGLGEFDEGCWFVLETILVNASYTPEYAISRSYS